MKVAALLNSAVAIVIITCGLSATAQAANILTNSGFELPVQSGNGNHIGATPTGWAASAVFNLVRDPGNGQGGSDQYVDLTTGPSYVDQSFTLVSPSRVDFGAYFSERDGAGGNGSTQIYDSTNTILLASSTAVATGTSFNWNALSENPNVILGAGTYVFRSTFDDAVNTDSPFVNVTPVPEPSSLAALGGIGAMGLFMAVRRRRKA